MLSDDTLNLLAQAKRILIAYSGGLDSSVLLDLLCSNKMLRNKTKIAIHINHQLSNNAEQWQQHCQITCESYQIKCISKIVSLNINSGESLESLARDARYQVFAKLIKKGDVLLTAHHQDDQAETLLLQLFRGAGIRGMAAMPVKKVFFSGTLFRPLLNFTQAQLQQYANTHNLQWISDESNFNVRFDRNYLRHEIMPQLKTRWPALISNLARSAQHHAAAQKIIQQQAAQDLILIQDEIDQLYINKLLSLTVENQENVLRYWIERNSQPLPSCKILKKIMNEVVLAKSDAEPCVKWQKTEVRRYQNKLYIMSTLQPFDNRQIIPWNNQYDISGLDLKELSGTLTIRFRQGGERVQLIGGQHSQSLKKVMQSRGIPPWLRDRIPLLYCDDKLIMIIDIR
jgi:tRNA(Ile)-lysidine synthase